MEEVAGSRLVAVSFGAEDPMGLARFWAGALRWEIGEPVGDEVSLVPTDDTPVTVRFVPLTTDQTSRRRLHLDLTTASGADQHESVEQLLALGGSHLDVGQSEDETHVVLADPEGNALCILAPGNSFLAESGRLGAINCDGNRQTGVFWSAALGWPLVWDQDEETAIRDPFGPGPMITWSGPPLNPKAGVNRLRLEVAPRPDVASATEVDRLVALGATRVDPGPFGEGDDEILLADPDGNELCVLERH